MAPHGPLGYAPGCKNNIDRVLKPFDRVKIIFSDFKIKRKLYKKDACFAQVDKLFQTFVPLNEKHFYSLDAFSYMF